MGVELSIENPLLFIDLSCVNCLRRSPASSEPVMFGSERPTTGGTSYHSELHTSFCPLISSVLHCGTEPL